VQQLSPRSSLAAACGYALSRWKALLVYLDHGQFNIDSNLVERTIRGVALGRSNWTFAVSDSGGHRAALMFSLVETCKLNGVDPLAYLKDVLTRLPTLPHTRLGELLPWNWASADKTLSPSEINH
jgi:transposase